MPAVVSEVLPWATIKERITNSLTNPVGHRLLEDLYSNLPKYFDETTLSDMIDKCRTCVENPALMAKVHNRMVELLNVAKKYTVRDPWYSVLSVKLVLPSPCQAKCKFCYIGQKDYDNQVGRDSDYNVVAIVKTLRKIMTAALDRPISIEITGGEPTSNIANLARLMNELADQGITTDKQVKRITLTTNGYRLGNVLDIIGGVVDYVNVSLHSTNYDERKEIFGTDKIPDDWTIPAFAEELYKRGIDMSGVFVVNDFSMGFDKFDTANLWCQEHGLVSTRWRSNVFMPNKVTLKQFTEQLADTGLYKLIVYEEAKDSSYSILTRDGSHLVYLLDGVEDSTQTSLGVSVLIRADGKAFHDASCNMPVINFGERGFLPLKYVYDKKDV